MKKVPTFEEMVNAVAYSTWNDGPGKINAITALNSEDIDYQDWDDMKIYLWDKKRLEEEED